MADGWLEIPFNLHGRRVWVAGHTGMAGAAAARRLRLEGCELIGPGERIDLRDQAAAHAWIGDARPDVIVLAAARVGGIEANRTMPADFLYDNLMIAANVIEGARLAGVRKLVYLGSSCIYPRLALQPIAEEALLGGALEPTNEAYALAKIAGVKMCEFYRAQHGCDFISLMPCNLYGPGDTYDARRSHVIPALFLKAMEARAQGAREMVVWGSGRPMREFLHVDDLAEAVCFALGRYSGPRPLNVGSGQEVSIAELAGMIAGLCGFGGALRFDESMPDGAPRKVLDSSRLRGAGWAPKVALADGLARVYAELRD